MKARRPVRVTDVALLVAVLFGWNVAWAELPVTVKTYGQHVGPQVVYQYEVTNHTTNRKVPSIAIGLNYGYDDPNTPSNDQAELAVHPVGAYWAPGPTVGDQAGISLLKGGTYTAPQGWTGYPQVHEGTDWVSFHFKTTDPNLVIMPGQTARFSITVPKIDRAYVSGHFTAGLRDGPGQMHALDTTAPTVSATARPANIWPPNGKLIAITAVISVKDDYDPQPEIKLESITANEPLGADDVVGAAIGTDDRSFSLRATRAGGNPAGRIYTITYSATDGTGNKATASATVTVPHDQGK